MAIDGVNLERQERLHLKHENLTETLYKEEGKGMLPSRYVFVLTNRCNLDCDFCFQSKLKLPDPMTTSDWINLTDQIPGYARVSITGGEPLVFSGFKDVFSYVASNFDCNVMTNGTLLEGGIIDFMLSYPNFGVLSISIDDIGNKVRKVKPAQWKRTEEGMKYFAKRKAELSSQCVLDVKTMILDQTADVLFDSYVYFVEELGADTVVFNFLKGSPLQHADTLSPFETIFERTSAPGYKRLDKIVEQLEQVRSYNIKHGRQGTFLHPRYGSLVSDRVPLNLDIVNTPYHQRANFQACKYPWSSVHINADGSLMPCLAVPIGNVKHEKLADIIRGVEMSRFRSVIRENGTVNGCNQCGWIKPVDIKERFGYE